MMPTMSTTARRALALAALATAAGLLSVGRADAVSTRRFVLDRADQLDDGELFGAAVHSDGRVTPSAEVEGIDLPPEIAVVYSLARAGDGTLYLGTGNDGRVYRVQRGQVELLGETGQALVTSLAIGPDGAVFAGTLPEGRIFRVDPSGVSELARPDDVEGVWDLLWDPRRRRLFAATGPEGHVVSIAPSNGRVELWWDSAAAHVMSLALDGEGELLAGTSGDAVVARIRAPEQLEIVHDFPGNEITALAVRGDVIAVAANEFPDPPRLTDIDTSRRRIGRRSPTPRPGKGRLFRIGAEGRAERVVEQDDGHFASVAVLDGGVILGGAGAAGRIVRVEADRTTSTWIDVEERQILALDFEGDDAVFATGDGPALYRVRGRPRQARWESPALDGLFPARFGRLEWRGDGAITFETRSGNTETPDGSWSPWSSPLRQPGPIRSPQARFLQLRANLPSGSTLYAVTAFYLPQNQRSVVSDVRVHAGSKAAEERAREIRQGFIPDPAAVYKLVWNVENPDDDRVRYRLRYRLEGQSIWRDMLPPGEVLTEREYEWDTQALPDGYYVVEVEASDELDNPAGLTLRDRNASEPLRVDNHAPEIGELQVRGGRLTGRARDGLGPIARLEVAVDGDEWTALFPDDDLFDRAEERFSIDLSSLAPGIHVVAVRATDASGNSGSAEAQVTR
jgi:hypothetical protein